MKILYITTIGITMGFFNSFIKQLLDVGHKVDIATDETNSKVPECYREWGCKIYPISCSRSPMKKGNLDAVYQIRKIVKANHYNLVHCHTPVASICTRLACRPLRKSGVKIFYTAHGFHFYRGASRKNWLIYYPLELFCSYFTDVLVTINSEDYELAKKNFHAKKVVYVPGVGIDTKKFGTRYVDKKKKRTEIGIPVNATLVLSVGELNENKNHETAIKAMNELDTYYIIVGKGDKKEYLEKLVYELDLQGMVKLLGYRDDVDELYRISDAFLFPSYREGLSVSVMEAMASGLPCVVSRIRGNTDLIDENGGALFAPTSVKECKAALESVLTKSKVERERMGKLNCKTAKRFDLNYINQVMKQIYMNSDTKHERLPCRRP